jgi:hypothetical protein
MAATTIPTMSIERSFPLASDSTFQPEGPSGAKPNLHLQKNTRNLFLDLILFFWLRGASLNIFVGSRRGTRQVKEALP